MPNNFIYHFNIIQLRSLFCLLLSVLFIIILFNLRIFTTRSRINTYSSHTFLFFNFVFLPSFVYLPLRLLFYRKKKKTQLCRKHPHDIVASFILPLTNQKKKCNFHISFIILLLLITIDYVLILQITIIR